jgi:hypothetical protein
MVPFLPQGIGEFVLGECLKLFFLFPIDSKYLFLIFYTLHLLTISLVITHLSLVHIYYLYPNSKARMPLRESLTCVEEKPPWEFCCFVIHFTMCAADVRSSGVGAGWAVR